MVRRISVVSQKGGVGKTTVSVTLAVAMARRMAKGRRLLFIDGDPSGNSTASLTGGQSPSTPGLTEVLLDDSLEPEDLEEIVRQSIRPSRYPGIDLLPSHRSLVNCAILLTNEPGRENRLRNALDALGDSYDVVLIDSSPAETLVSWNAIHAAEELIIPVDLAGVYSIMGLAAVEETIARIRRHCAHPTLAVIGLVLTRVIKSAAARELEAQLRQSYGKLVFTSTIPFAPQVPLAEAHFQTVLEFAPRSAAALAFEALTMEVLGNHGRKPRVSARSHSVGTGKRKRRAS